MDVYAFAIICYQLFEGYPAFYMLDAVSAAREASGPEHRRPEFGAKNRWGRVVPQALKDLVTECWDPDYHKRPEFEDVVPRLR